MPSGRVVSVKLDYRRAGLLELLRERTGKNRSTLLREALDLLFEKYKHLLSGIDLSKHEAKQKTRRRTGGYVEKLVLFRNDKNYYKHDYTPAFSKTNEKIITI